MKTMVTHKAQRSIPKGQAEAHFQDNFQEGRLTPNLADQAPGYGAQRYQQHHRYSLNHRAGVGLNLLVGVGIEESCPEHSSQH